MPTFFLESVQVLNSPRIYLIVRNNTSAAAQVVKLSTTIDKIVLRSGTPYTYFTTIIFANRPCLIPNFMFNFLKVQTKYIYNIPTVRSLCDWKHFHIESYKTLYDGLPQSKTYICIYINIRYFTNITQTYTTTGHRTIIYTTFNCPNNNY